jgi:hypothetical protein
MVRELRELPQTANEMSERRAELTLLRESLRRTHRGRGGAGCLEDSKDGDS